MSASVGSKYSNLPDIDVEQPDVYETPDVPTTGPGNEAESSELPLSEDISVSSIPGSVAAERFRAASGDIDGHSALARYQRSLFRTLQLESLSQDGRDLEVLSGQPTKETTEQRLRRLVYEAQEVEQQLKTQQTGGKQKAVALMKLAAELNSDLLQLSDATRGNSGGQISKDQWQRLAGEQESHKDVKHKQKAIAGIDVGQLEARIAALERTVGVSDTAAIDAAVGHGLVATVSRLRKQIEVIADPQRVDGIQRRVKQALVDMDRLAATQTKGDNNKGLDPAVVSRINDLYDKMVNVDALIELAPATARRLQSLAKLHAQAADVVARIGRIESEQHSIGDELGSIRDVASGLTSSMAGNAEALTDNMRHLDTRIASLSERLAALARR